MMCRVIGNLVVFNFDGHWYRIGMRWIANRKQDDRGNYFTHTYYSRFLIQNFYRKHGFQGGSKLMVGRVFGNLVVLIFYGYWYRFRMRWIASRKQVTVF